MKNKMLLTLSGLALCSGAFAETEKPWEATAEVGIIATSGNTETTTAQAKGDVKQRTSRLHNHYILSVLYKEDKITLDDDTTTKEKTAEKYFGSAKSAYQLQRENTNLFVFGSHTDDKFGAYRKYSTLAVGYGARLFESANKKLDVEIGPGYFRAEQLREDDTTQSESGFLLRGAAAFKWEITDTAEFNQTVSTESAEDNTRTIAESSLSTRINGAMQMKVGFNVANDSNVAPGKKKTDTTTYVNLVYKF
jgi:putative salt-induced outer membrane protein